MLTVPPDAAVACDWLTLRRIPASTWEPGREVARVGPLVVLPSGECLGGPMDELHPVGRRMLRHEGEHLALAGQFFRLGGTAVLEETVAAWGAGAEAVSLVRADFAVELGRLWDGDAGAELEDLVQLADRLELGLEAPRSGWSRSVIQSETGCTVYLGVRGRDEGKGMRKRDPFWRLYSVRDRAVVRVEVERKGFAGLPPAGAYWQAASEAASALGVPFADLGFREQPNPPRRTPLARIAAQARGMVCGALLRQGVEVDPVLLRALRIIDERCGVTPAASAERERRWGAENVRRGTSDELEGELGRVLRDTSGRGK